MYSITDEQAELLRKNRSRCHQLRKTTVEIATILGNPLCQHEQLNEDSKDLCEYCQFLNCLYTTERYLESLTDLLDRLLINGPKVRN